MREKPIVLYEDEWLLVVNKPAGVVVNRAETVKGETIQDWIEGQRWWGSTPSALRVSPPKLGEEEMEIFIRRSGIAHRLDKETSGALLVAKNEAVLEDLLKQFKNRVVQKEYLALVHGRLEPRKGIVRLPLKRTLKDRRRWGVDVEGKMAETEWEVEEYFLKQDLSLVKLFPKTGRTHQIRVHMAHLGHPLVADEKYLSSKRLRLDRQVLSRHFLHARGLEFEHPVTRKVVKVEAPLPGELEGFLLKLKGEAS